MIKAKNSAKTYIIISITLLVGILPAGQSRISDLMREGEKNYRMALDGDQKKLEAAIEYFLAVLSQQPNNHLTRVFLGGCYSLKGQRPKHVFNNLYWGTKGLNLMDNAVKAAPDNYRVRLERAINSLHLNSHFYRDPIAGKDLRVLLSRTDFSGISNQLKQLTWLYAGLYFKRESKLDKSLQMWHNVIELDPKSNISRKAQKLLQKYKE